MTTRAIRRFTDEPVTDDELRTCLAAAQQAPSGGNVQPQQYLVVTDPDVKAAVAGWYRKAFDRYEASLPDPTRVPGRGAGARGGAPGTPAATSPTTSARRRRSCSSSSRSSRGRLVDDDGEMDIGRLDASVYPAVQNFCVAARSLGLGTALTTVIRIHTAEVLADLGVPEGRYEIAALVPVGRPAGRFGVARASRPTPSPTGTAGATAAQADPPDPGFPRLGRPRPQGERGRGARRAAALTPAGPAARTLTR